MKIFIRLIFGWTLLLKRVILFLNNSKTDVRDGIDGAEERSIGYLFPFGPQHENSEPIRRLRIAPVPAQPGKENHAWKLLTVPVVVALSLLRSRQGDFA